ncbi:MAG: Gfo/Idh/MocA family oxidoreductase [Verrucomicrobiota bacterium]
MGRQVKVGIIGFGFMGTTHFDIYNNNEKATVVAMADVNPAKRAGDISAVFANIGGGDNSKPVDLSGIRVYADGMDLINDPEIELVDICVPVYLHKQYALAAIAAGKGVLCEKPLARTSADAQEIADAAERAGVKIMAGMCIRFWPEYSHALETVKSGAVGKILSAAFKRVSPDVAGSGWEDWFMNSELSGGAILDLHLHDVDYVRQLMGMPKAVTAFGAKGVRSDNGVDHVLSRFDYGDGTLVTIEGGWSPAKATPFEMGFQIVCEKATLRLAADGYSVIGEDGTVEQPQVAKEGLPTGWHVEIDYLLDCIINDVKPDMPLNEVVEAIRLVEAEQESIDQNKTVKI